MSQPGTRHVFESITIGSVEVKNRIFLSPHGILHNISDPNHPGFALPSPDATAYFAARARGGVGLIIQGGTQVHPSSVYPANETYHLFDEAAVEAFTQLVAAVHEHGTKMFLQLWHAGHHGDHFSQYGGPYSASAIQPVESPAAAVKAMTKDEIHMIVQSYADTTRNAARAGYDGVEIHATHTYLPEQFLSPFFNKRTDEYGGSLENRMRFLLEVLEAVHEVSGSMAVGIRFICDEGLPGGLSEDDCREIATKLDGTGLIDFFNLDIGTYHEFDATIITPWPVPQHVGLEPIARVGAGIRRAVRLGVPTRFRDPTVADEWIRDGKLDMVGGARGFIADPDLVRKAAEGRSREIKPCIGMMTCLTPSGCAVNPTYGLGIEGPMRKDDIERAATSRRVLIVGAGPAGLEAGRVAALRGHEVQIIDEQPRIGGTLNLVAAIPGREGVLEAVDWWAAELERLNVTLALKTKATVDVVTTESPDVVLVATGARYATTGSTGFRPSLAEGAHPAVLGPEAVLEGSLDLVGTVVVLDEEAIATGSGVAEAMAARGLTVELVSRWPQPAMFVNMEFPLWYGHMRRRLEEAGVRTSTHSYVECTGSSSVTVFDIDTGARRPLENVSAIVPITTRQPQLGLAGELVTVAAEVHVLGDALFPGNMGKAIRTSWDLVRTL